MNEISKDHNPDGKWANGNKLTSTGRIGEPGLVDKLVAKVRAGSFFTVAARAAGLSDGQFNKWRQRGRRDLAAFVAGEVETLTPYAVLVQRVEQATAEAIDETDAKWKATHEPFESVKVVEDGDGNVTSRETRTERPDWRSMRDYLAVKCPERYAKAPTLVVADRVEVLQYTGEEREQLSSMLDKPLDEVPTTYTPSAPITAADRGVLARVMDSAFETDEDGVRRRRGRGPGPVIDTTAVEVAEGTGDEEPVSGLPVSGGVPTPLGEGDAVSELPGARAPSGDAGPGRVGGEGVLDRERRQVDYDSRKKLLDDAARRRRDDPGAVGSN